MKIFCIFLVVASLLVTAITVIFSNYEGKEQILVNEKTPISWSSPNFRGVHQNVTLTDRDFFNIIMIATMPDGQKINSEPILVQVFILDNGGILIKEQKPNQQEIYLHLGDSWITTVDFGEYGTIESMIFKYRGFDIYSSRLSVVMTILNEN